MWVRHGTHTIVRERGEKLAVCGFIAKYGLDVVRQPTSPLTRIEDDLVVKGAVLARLVFGKPLQRHTELAGWPHAELIEALDPWRAEHCTFRASASAVAGAPGV